MIQQRAAHVELEDQRRQIKELTVAKQQLQTEVSDLKDRLEVEFVAKNEEISRYLRLAILDCTDVVTAAKRQLQLRLQELEISSSASSTVHSGIVLWAGDNESALRFICRAARGGGSLQVENRCVFEKGGGS